MEEIGGYLMLWLIQAAVAVVLSAPIVWLSRKRIDWQLWELLAFVLPFVFWAGLMVSDLSLGKSLSNLVESIYLAFAIPVAAMMRVAIGKRVSQNAIATVNLVGLCVVAIAIFFLTPPLPRMMIRDF